VKQVNYVTQEMKDSGYIPGTDSRLRGDQSLFEQGRMEEADVEKIRLEVK
jgi:hypothetical protein